MREIRAQTLIDGSRVTLTELRNGSYLIERDGEQMEDPIATKQEALAEFRRTVEFTNRGIELEREQSRGGNNTNRRRENRGFGGFGGGGFFGEQPRRDDDRDVEPLIGDPFGGGDGERGRDGESLLDVLDDWFGGGKR